MIELTAAARKNVAAGRVTGPGTDTCRRCNGPKEPTRVNSDKCKRCNSPTVTHVLKVELPSDVMDALKREAAAHELSPAERVAFLLTKKYRK